MAPMQPAFASEGGSDSIGKGSEGFFAGSLPANPGLFAVVYLNDYEADRLRDGRGKEVPSDFRLSARVAVARLFYMSPLKIVGGRLGFFAIGSAASLTSRMGSSRARHEGWSDVTVGPVLGWKVGALHPAVATDIVIPVGSYEAARPLNAGSNHFVIRPIFNLSYLPAGGLELSIKTSYTFNARNEATRYSSGDLLHADLSASYPVGSTLRLGVNGYILRQTGDDRIGGVRVGTDGHRGRVDAIGPALQWRAGRATVDVKALQEFDVRNRAQGKSLWLRVVAGL